MYVCVSVCMCVCVCVCVCVCAHWGISLPSKTPALPLFCQAPHKSENC